MAGCILASKRPILNLPFLLPSCDSTALELRRSQSSYRRTKQRLRVKPDASFGILSEGGDHIVYNPPSSLPSAYNTPIKFLPPSDIRKTLRTPATPYENPKDLRSIFKTCEEKKYHLSPPDIEEIRRLRLSDPITWSRWKLAKRFECSPMFIGMVCEAGPQKKEIQKQVLEAVQSRWGAKRRMAREDRKLRKETWGRDD